MSKNQVERPNLGEKKDVVHTAMEISPTEIQAVVQSEEPQHTKLATLKALKQEVQQRMKASAKGAELEPLLSDLDHAIEVVARN